MMKEKGIEHQEMGVEELALDEGVTSYSSLCRTFPLDRVFSYAETKALRI